jgi:hypothetical protein
MSQANERDIITMMITIEMGNAMLTFNRCSATAKASDTPNIGRYR